ncbi:MAG: DUF1759 domain-containing protein [Bacteroidota bacterium]
MVTKTSLHQKNIRKNLTLLIEATKVGRGVLNIQVPVSQVDIEARQEQISEQIDILQQYVQIITKTDKAYVETLAIITDPEESKKEEDIYDGLAMSDSGYFGVLDQAYKLISGLKARYGRLSNLAATPGNTPANSPLRGIASHININQSEETPAMATIKLPKIDLPTFDGDLLRYREFMSIFKSAVHNRTDLTNVMKLTYLIPLLKGEAAEIVKGYLHTDENYDIIFSRIEERYNRTDDRLISMLHSELKRISKASGSVKDKRKTMDSCERVFRQLEQMGQSLDPGKSLVYDLLGKFQPGMIRDLDRRYHVGVYSDLSDVRKTIEKSISEEELTQGFLQDLSVGETNGAKKRDHNSGSNQNQNRDSTFFSNNRRPYGFRSRGRGFSTGRGSGPGAMPRRLPCYFCGQTHGNEYCLQYPTAASRIERLRELNRCLRCMQQHRPGYPCNVYCHHCQYNNHHPALCRREYPDNADRSFRTGPTGLWPQGSGGTRGGGTASRGGGTTTRASTRGPVVHFSSDGGTTRDGDSAGNGSTSKENSGDGGTYKTKDSSQSAFDVSNFSKACSKNSLFQTAIVTGVNFKSGKRYRLRIVLDTLSNRTYITEQAASWLGLSADMKEKLYVSVFGSKKDIEIPSSLVSFGLERKDGGVLRITANTTRLISNSVILPEAWPENAADLLNSHLSDLADNPFDADKTVDILLGADYAWDVIAGPKVPLVGENIFLVPSIFGYMIGGQLYYEPRGRKSEFTMFCLTETVAQFPDELTHAAFESKNSQHLPPDIDEFWKLESIGISDNPVENDDENALESFRQSVRFQDGRYHVSWPWIEENRKRLPTNYDLAYRRFEILTNAVEI